MPCGCQYERLNWINRPQPCRGKLYLDTPLQFNADKKTAGQCTGTAHLKLVTTYDDLNGAIAGNMTKADLDDKNQYLEGTFRRIEDLTSPHFWEFGGK